MPDLVRTAEYYRGVLGFQTAGYWDGERVTLTPDAAPLFGIVFRDSVKVFFNRADQIEVRTGRAEGAYDAFFHTSVLMPSRTNYVHAAQISLTDLIRVCTTSMNSWSEIATA